MKASEYYRLKTEYKQKMDQLIAEEPQDPRFTLRSVEGCNSEIRPIFDLDDIRVKFCFQYGTVYSKDQAIEIAKFLLETFDDENGVEP